LLRNITNYQELLYTFSNKFKDKKKGIKNPKRIKAGINKIPSRRLKIQCVATMSSYLESGDSTDESVDNEKAISEEELAQVKEECAQLKAAGNELFSQSLYTEAIVKYSEAVKILKNAHLPKDSIILLNRCAAYLAINKYVPALNDANQGDYIQYFCNKQILINHHWNLPLINIQRSR
jgi:hypothetical protein